MHTVNVRFPDKKLHLKAVAWAKKHCTTYQSEKVPMTVFHFNNLRHPQPAVVELGADFKFLNEKDAIHFSLRWC